MVLPEQIPPSKISQLRRELSGLHYVREQNRGQDAIGVGPTPNPGEEFLDLVEDGVLVADPR